MQHAFTTPEPPVLFVEIGAGQVRVTATQTGQTTIEVTGHHADEVVVEQRGHEIVVIAPKRLGFFSGPRDLRVEAVVPLESELVTQLGSADLVVTGPLGWAKLTSGSGDVKVERITAEAVVTCGSGDIVIEHLTGPAKVSTGSGDVSIDRSIEPLVLKSGSGDLRVRQADADVVLTSGSGELRVEAFPAGKVTAKNASGDIHVGIPAGVPVWTDVMSVSGRVRSDLQGAGQPAEGQPYVEVRAKTASGNVTLRQI